MESPEHPQYEYRCICFESSFWIRLHISIRPYKRRALDARSAPLFSGRYVWVSIHFRTLAILARARRTCEPHVSSLCVCICVCMSHMSSFGEQWKVFAAFPRGNNARRGKLAVSKGRCKKRKGYLFSARICRRRCGSEGVLKVVGIAKISLDFGEKWKGVASQWPCPAV